MTVTCVRIEMDSTRKNFVFAFVMTEEKSSDLYISGEIRVTSENKDAYSIGQNYECYLK